MTLQRRVTRSAGGPGLPLGDSSARGEAGLLLSRLSSSVCSALTCGHPESVILWPRQPSLHLDQGRQGSWVWTSTLTPSLEELEIEIKIPVLAKEVGNAHLTEAPDLES